MTRIRHPDADARRPPAILHVVNALDHGGMEEALVSLIRATAGGPLRHAVCTLRHGGPLADRLPPSVPLVSLNARKIRQSCAARLARTVRGLRPDVVHARGWGTWADAALACALTGARRLVLGFHGLQSDLGFSRRDRRRARWLRCLCRRYTCVSYAGRRQMQTELALPEEWVEVIPNGVDPERFAPPMAPARAQTRASLGVSPGECIVGSVGSMTAVKDHATLLLAVADARRAGMALRLLLVGDGPLRSPLRDQVFRLGLSDAVLFAGQRDDVSDLLGAMDIYVSSSRSEGMSNAILQAMSAGLPVIATDVGDNGRLLERGEAGGLVPPSDPASLARAITATWHDRECCGRWGIRARRRVVEHYTLDRTVARYVGFYRSVATRVSRPGRRPHLEQQPSTAQV